MQDKEYYLTNKGENKGLNKNNEINVCNEYCKLKWRGSAMTLQVENIKGIIKKI